MASGISLIMALKPGYEVFSFVRFVGVQMLWAFNMVASIRRPEMPMVYDVRRTTLTELRAHASRLETSPQDLRAEGVRLGAQHCFRPSRFFGSSMGNLKSQSSGADYPMKSLPTGA